MDNLHHQLTRLHGGEHILAQSFLLHRIGKGLGNLIVHVSVEQSSAHILQGLGDINLSDLALTFQDLK